MKMNDHLFTFENTYGEKIYCLVKDAINEEAARKKLNQDYTYEYEGIYNGGPDWLIDLTFY